MAERNGLEIAVVGLSCRVGDIKTPQSLFTNLKKQRQLYGKVASENKDSNFVPVSSIVSNTSDFDPEFFGMNEATATLLDPQQRFLMKMSADVIHQGSLSTSDIGVFVSSGSPDYLYHELLPRVQNRTLQFRLDDLQRLNESQFTATRIAHHLQLKGPAMTIQTACSSSLVAIHMASRSLLTGECDAAIAGGCSLALPNQVGYYYRADDILAHDGFCRPFQSRHEGTVPASGGGVVLLTTLEYAEENHLGIIAVIRGSAVNNDGGNKQSYASPGFEGQVSVIRNALATAQLEPSDVHYVETHGTGTRIGDEIELGALKRVFARQSLNIGFSKANLGHADTGAGALGFIKTVCLLNQRFILPELFDSSNELPFQVETQGRSFAQETPRAGVTSLGVGGTNCHIILEAYPHAKNIDELELAPLQERKCWIFDRAVSPEGLLDILQDNLGEYDLNLSFSQNGGDSITALDICEYILKKFAVKISLDELYEFPSLQTLVDFVESNGKKNPPNSMKPNGIQEQFWMLSEMNPDSDELIIAFELKLIGDLDRIHAAISRVIEKHPLLKSRFELDDDGLNLVPNANVSILIEDNLEVARHKAMLPFDTSKILCRFISCGQSLFTSFHHTVMDGTSFDKFLLDFEAFYENPEQLVSPQIFIDPADKLGAHDAENQLTYWKEYLQPYSTQPNQQHETYQYKTISQEILGSRDEINAKAALRSETPFSFLLSLWLNCLPESGLVSFPFSASCDGIGPSIRNLIVGRTDNLKQTLFKHYSHAQVDVNRFFSEEQWIRKVKSHFIFEAETKRQLRSLISEIIPLYPHASQSPLTIVFQPGDEMMTFFVTYATNLYSQDQIQDLVISFKRSI